MLKKKRRKNSPCVIFNSNAVYIILRLVYLELAVLQQVKTAPGNKIWLINAY